MITWLENNKKISIIFLVIITIEIFFVSSLPGTLGISQSFSVAKAYHIIVFFLFALFLFTTIKGKNKLKAWQIVTVLIISIIYSILDEFHQSFVPGRDPALRDVMIDSFGIFLSILIYIYINSKKLEKTKKI